MPPAAACGMATAYVRVVPLIDSVTVYVEPVGVVLASSLATSTTEIVPEVVKCAVIGAVEMNVLGCDITFVGANMTEPVAGPPVASSYVAVTVMLVNDRNRRYLH